MRAAPPAERIEAWRPDVSGVREVFHARFVEHAYPPHTHDTWTVLIVDDGAVRYALDGHHHNSARWTVSVLPPHVVHDGRAATSRGFRKRVLYLDSDVLGEHLVGRAVDRPTIADEALVRRIRALHHALRRPVDLFEAETRLAFVAEGLEARLTGGQVEPSSPHRTAGGHELASRLRDLIDEHVFEAVTLGGAARVIGASPTHLVRSFSQAFGIAPHAYLIGRRIDVARDQLLDGRPPAEVATSVGFHDQPHLTRHFRRHVGTTPGRYAATRGS